jgi:hypothetical protein
MNKHTPGPWFVIDSFYPSIKEVKGPSFKINVVMWATDLTEKDYLKRLADLSLIAAAPELLEALKGCLQWMESLRSSGDAGNWGWEQDDEYIKGIAAIAKAEGEM